MLRQRVLTAIVAVVLLLSVLFYAPQPLVRVIIALLFMAAAWEWSQFLGSPSRAIRILYVALVVLAGGILALVFDDAAMRQWVFGVAVVWWLLALIWVFNFPTPIPSPLSWLCGWLIIVPAYIALDNLYLYSPWLLLALLVVIWLADIGAYFSGRALGRVKLAPRVSPGKTREGVVGGLVASLSAAAAMAVYEEANLLVVLPLCFAVVLMSVVGDLTVSMFKRHAGIKDSGTFFPGHGGILDRIDGVSAAAPVFAAGSRALGLY